MSRYDYPDPGLDPAYCDPLSAGADDDAGVDEAASHAGPAVILEVPFLGVPATYEVCWSQATVRRPTPDQVLVLAVENGEVLEAFGAPNSRDWRSARAYDISGQLVADFRKDSR